MGRWVPLCWLIVTGCTCAPGALPDGGVRSDGGVIITPGSVATYADFCTTQVAIWCSKLVECKTVSVAASVDCTDYLGRYCAALNPSLERGYRRYHPDVATACLTAFQTQTDCDALSSFFGPSCNGVLTPLAPAGGPCLAEGDCAATGEYCVGTGCALTCTPQGGANQPCAFETNCDSGLRCDATKICRGPLPAGSACVSSQNQCDGNTFSDPVQNLCVVRPGAGQPSSVDVFARCAPDAWCDTSTSAAQCRPRAMLGQPCTPVSCVEGAYCDRVAAQPTCKSELVDGAPCTGFDECAGTFGVCDPLLLVCERLGTRVATGQPCSTFRQCENFNDSCKGQVPNPDGGRGIAGTCLRQALGDPCTSSYDCPTTSYCASADGGSRCEAARLGTPCRDDSECAVEAYCGPTTCLARGQAGSPCDLLNRSCSGSLQCRPTSVGAMTGVCGEPGLAGEPCSAASGYRQCSLPFECVSGVCTEHGRTGEACLQVFFGSCISGSCADRQTCAPFASEGQSCRSSLDCGAGSCQSMTCSAVCR